MFELDAVSKSYGTHQALSPTTVSIAPGETTVLIGPSGCGKSTMLRLMLGLIEPDSGTIRLGDDEVRHATARSLRRRMGYVIQDGGLFPHLTARGNATLMAKHLGWPVDRIAARLADLSALTAFPADGLDRYPAQLSGGQRQRVSLMRALMLEPEVLLLDEPLGALDPMIRADLQRDLREVFRALEKTVVIVTHDMGEAAYLADTIVLMRGGRIVQTGTFEDLNERPAEAFVSDFIGAQRSPIAGVTPSRDADSDQGERAR